MIFLIIPIIGFFIGFGYSIWEWGRLDGDALLYGMMGLLLGLLFAIVLVLLIGAFTPTEMVLVDEYNIYALADNSRYESYVSGNAFLIRGHSKEDLVYQFMYIKDGKGYAFMEADATKSYLNYLSDANGTPKVEIYCEKYTSDFMSWLIGADLFGSDQEYIFWLPQDAKIVDSFIVDFE